VDWPKGTTQGRNCNRSNLQCGDIWGNRFFGDSKESLAAIYLFTGNIFYGKEQGKL